MLKIRDWINIYINKFLYPKEINLNTEKGIIINTISTAY